MSLHPPSSPKRFLFVIAGKGVAVEQDLGRDEGGRRWLAGRMLPQQNAAVLLLYVFPSQSSSRLPTMLLSLPGDYHPGKAPLAFAELTKTIKSPQPCARG